MPKFVKKVVKKIGTAPAKSVDYVDRKLRKGKKPKYGKGLRVNTRSVQNLNRGLWGL